MLWARLMSAVSGDNRPPMLAWTNLDSRTAARYGRRVCWVIKNLTQNVPAQQRLAKHIKPFQLQTRTHASLLLPFWIPLASVR